MAQESYPQLHESEGPKGLSDEEFGELVSNESVNHVYGVALRIVRDPDDAQDVVQETFMRAWQARDKFEHRSQPGTWLHKIARNSALTHYRKKKRDNTNTYSLDDEELPLAQRKLAGDHSVEEEVVERLMSDDLSTHVRGLMERHLPKATRVALLMAAVGVAYKVIADEVGAPSEGAVRVRIHRGKMQLKSLLEAD